MFLTAEQLETLTGRRQAAAQIRWLQKYGIRHWVRADGRPSVLTEALNGMTPAAVAAKFEPDFAALRH